MSETDVSPERAKLEARAAELGIAFRGNWKDETLAEKIKEAEAAQSVGGEAELQAAGTSPADASAPVSETSGTSKGEEAEAAQSVGGEAELQAAGKSPADASALVSETSGTSKDEEAVAGQQTGSAPDRDASGEPRVLEVSANPTSNTPDPDDDVEALIITGPKAGRRRANRHFTPEPVTIPISDLTDDEIAALTADPKLTVERV